MSDVFRFADDLGPAKILYIHNAKVGLKAITVVDNTACGPSMGGVRMAPDVTVEEAFRLARAMTFKNAGASLPHGGGKSVIYGDPKMPVERKEEILRAFACAIRGVEDYIPGPDMGTDEVAMGWVKDEIGRAVGLPRGLGGIPLDEIGATGFGLAAATEVACREMRLPLEGARIAIQGFGAVGKHAARFLTRMGCKLVACSDSHGTVTSKDGLDVEALIEVKDAGKSVTALPGVNALPVEAIVGVSCDVWIPAARPDVLRKDNAPRLDARLVVPGVNIPCTPEAEAILHSRGILLLPDFIVNAGGVICACVEYHGGSEKGAFAQIDETIRRNTYEVIDLSRKNKQMPRDAAVQMVRSRLDAASRARRWR